MVTKEEDYSNCNYKNCLLSYVDVLGFKNKIINESCSQIAYSLNSFVNYSNEPDEYKNIFGFKHIAFSDTALRIYEIVDKPICVLLFEITNIGMIQCSQILQNTLLRGCLSYGSLYADNNVFFGQSLVDAYEYETKYIHNPFIAIHPKLIECINRKDEIYNILVKKDEYKLIVESLNVYRGKFYIDYLQVLFSVLEKANAIDVLRVHKAFILENISRYQDSKKILSKYIWMKNYHNVFIGKSTKYKEFKI